MATDHHAEHVGSLLRPPWLRTGRTAAQQGELAAERLGELEDRAALAAIRLQQQAGMGVFTDGEMRRATWMAGLLESLGGVTRVPAPDVRWHRPGGDPPAAETEWEMVAASGKLTQKAQHTSVEAAFLAARAPGPFKITMMSAAMGRVLWQPGISEAAYPDQADLVRDLVALQRQEIEGLIGQGVSWIQLDSLGYNNVFDPGFRAAAGLAGVPPEAILGDTITVDAELAAAAKQRSPDVTIGLHICRGNNRSAWMSQGSYEPVAERLFNEVGADRFLLEFDTERAGGFEPLRFVPPGPVVVLGLVSSKDPRLESPDELCRRVEQAAKYVPPENLALSPQCGFASTAPGNLLSFDDQRRKLELVAETARTIWG